MVVESMTGSSASGAYGRGGKEAGIKIPTSCRISKGRGFTAKSPPDGGRDSQLSAGYWRKANTAQPCGARYNLVRYFLEETYAKFFCCCCRVGRRRACVCAGDSTAESGHGLGPYRCHGGGEHDSPAGD